MIFKVDCIVHCFLVQFTLKNHKISQKSGEKWKNPRGLPTECSMCSLGANTPREWGTLGYIRLGCTSWLIELRLDSLCSSLMLFMLFSWWKLHGEKCHGENCMVKNVMVKNVMVINVMVKNVYGEKFHGETISVVKTAWGKLTMGKTVKVKKSRWKVHGENTYGDNLTESRFRDLARLYFLTF